MKRLYFDTSYLFRIYSSEPGHELVKERLATVDVVASAWHARAEFAAVILRKQREGLMTRRSLAALSRQFRQDQASQLFSLLPLTEEVMQRLELVFEAAPPTAFLRAADALHLACAAQNGFTEVYSNDRHFLAAAGLFGLQGINLIPEAD